MKKINFTNEQIQDMAQLYQKEGLSLKKIGEKYNVSRSVITRVLKENNIAIRTDNHIYKADYRKFQYIDSPEKAYWLGFIAADGCVYERENNASIIINLHRDDREHLEKFKRFMNSNVNIVDHIQTNNTLMSKITYNSKEMAHDLISKNITPRKSLTLLPPNIEDKYSLAFILGYFDGDGSIFKTSQYNNYGINIEGTAELLTWINNKLNISNKLERRDPTSTTNNYYIRCGGTNKPYQIMKQLYDSANVHLERKYQIFKSLETVVLSRNTK